MIVSGSDGLEFPDGSDQGTAFTGNAATITSGTLDAARLPSSNVNAASITIGTIATARLATGTANASTYLRGDQTWVEIPSVPIVITPTNVSPTNSATNIFPGQVLSATGFFALYGYTFANAQWQVSTASNFSTTVFDSGTSGAAVTSITTSDTYIDENTTYYWRVRYKASDGTFSAYSSAFSFTTATAFSYAIDYLVVAGGGSGGGNAADGNQRAGGGGAGGFRTATGMTLDVGTAYSVTVGAGGATASGDSANQGSDSIFNSITSLGGGAGGHMGAGPASGGSGGGGSAAYTSGASGTAGQGNAGASSTSYNGYGGGGGGAGAGGSADSGGSGTASSYSGSSVTYAGGGGGGNSGSGGAGGGGSALGGAGTANTGGGGGAGFGSSGGAGGSGVVIIRYPGSQRGTGGTVTSSGGNTIHTFTSSGTYTA
jgi:hypothetical protein